MTLAVYEAGTDYLPALIDGSCFKECPRSIASNVIVEIHNYTAVVEESAVTGIYKTPWWQRSTYYLSLIVKITAKCYGIITQISNIYNDLVIVSN